MLRVHRQGLTENTYVGTTTDGKCLLLGFGDTIVLLTAVHFHYAGFALLLLAGLAGRRLRAGTPVVWGIFRLVADYFQSLRPPDAGEINLTRV